MGDVMDVMDAVPEYIVVLVYDEYEKSVSTWQSEQKANAYFDDHVVMEKYLAKIIRRE